MRSKFSYSPISFALQEQLATSVHTLPHRNQNQQFKHYTFQLYPFTTQWIIIQELNHTQLQNVQHETQERTEYIDYSLVNESLDSHCI